MLHWMIFCGCLKLFLFRKTHIKLGMLYMYWKQWKLYYNYFYGALKQDFFLFDLFNKTIFTSLVWCNVWKLTSVLHPTIIKNVLFIWLKSKYHAFIFKFFSKTFHAFSKKFVSGRFIIVWQFLFLKKHKIYFMNLQNCIKVKAQQICFDILDSILWYYFCNIKKIF